MQTLIRHVRLTWWHLILLVALWLPVSGGKVRAQSELAAKQGFRSFSSRHLTLTTDLPQTTGGSTAELPAAFEAALPLWCEAFGVPMEQAADWRAEAFLMLERDRFDSRGLIPAHLPEFPYGFQFGDRMWVLEQPSVYYRRHLLLHEGTHWFMHRTFGSNGPPWIMEGMAEWLGTHSWNAATKQLQMGMIPEHREDFPYWGRLRKIRDQLDDGSAPSLESIMRYDSSAHQRVEAYAWSWAAVVFLRHHPRTRDAFAAMMQQPMHDDLRQTRWFFGQLRDQWPIVREEWHAFLYELDYGFGLEQGLTLLSDSAPVLQDGKHQCSIDTSQGWQSSGRLIAPDTRLRVQATGNFVVNHTSKPWDCTPAGVTLEYYRGQPLGKLMMAIASPRSEEMPSRPFEVHAVGADTSLQLQTGGELLFRINESTGQLSDNQGEVFIELNIDG